MLTVQYSTDLLYIPSSILPFLASDFSNKSHHLNSIWSMCVRSSTVLQIREPAVYNCLRIHKYPLKTSTMFLLRFHPGGQLATVASPDRSLPSATSHTLLDLRSVLGNILLLLPWSLIPAGLLRTLLRSTLFQVRSTYGYIAGWLAGWFGSPTAGLTYKQLLEGILQSNHTSY